MKKSASLPLFLALVLALVYPAAILILAVMGWNLELEIYFSVMAAMTLLNILLVLRAFDNRGSANLLTVILSMLLPAANALNMLMLTIADGTRTSGIIALANLFFVTVVAALYHRNPVTDILKFLLSAIPVLLAVLVSFAVIKDPAAANPPPRFETVLELPSPEGRYAARVAYAPDFTVADSNTSVSILYPGIAPVEFGVGRLTRDSELLTLMAWEDFNLSDLSWKDEHTLTLCGEDFIIADHSIRAAAAAEKY